VVIPINGVYLSAVYGFGFCTPSSALFNRAHSEHYVSVWVPLADIMYADIGAHSGGHELLFDKPAGKRNVLLPREFNGQRDFDFPRQLSVTISLGLFHGVP